jgi:hypothetical protein
MTCIGVDPADFRVSLNPGQRGGLRAFADAENFFIALLLTSFL